MAVTSTPPPPLATSTDGVPLTNSGIWEAVNDGAQMKSTNFTAHTPPNVMPQRTKQKKAKNERKQTAQQDSEDVQRPATMTASKKNAAPSTADTLLFQRLAHDMTDALMNAGNLKDPTESLDLMKRLSSAALKSTITTNVTTTTTTTTELNVVLEKEVTAVPRDRCTRRTPKTYSSDSDSGSENTENETTAFTHISNQATKVGHLLPSYQVASYAARKVNLMTASRRSPNTFTLGDFAALAALESLAERYGRVSHMGILDPSYTFFINQARTAALYYKSKASL